MYINRSIDICLEEWAAESGRKPLLLRGARQIGKTTAVRHLAEKFDSFVEVNFEEEEGVAAIFDRDFDIRRILSAIETNKDAKIEPGKTLLFLDEIQLCPRAISALRYFYEKCPDLHVIATGSLLEFAFGDMADFGVGRIRNAFMHPLSFAEFVSATGGDVALGHAREATFERPFLDGGHEKMLERLKTFMIVGGMPAAVRKYIETGSLLDSQRQHRDILVSLRSDFGKYKKRIPASRILSTFQSILDQAGEKFTFTDSEAGIDYRQAKECTTLLEMARLVYRIDATNANGIPLGGDVKKKDCKYLPLDTGLYLTAAGLDLSTWILDPPTKFVNRGKLAELFVALEIAKSGSPLDEKRLFYWHREARNSNAEVDNIVQFRNRVLPIEVKSGRKGAMTSLRMLMDAKNLSFAVRTSEENFGIINGKVYVIPLYMIGEYERILRAADVGNGKL